MTHLLKVWGRSSYLTLSQFIEVMRSRIKSWMIVQTVAYVVEMGRCSGNVQALFKRKENTYLANHVIRTEQSGSELQCAAFCSRESLCVSVNYKISGEKQGMCELNNKLLEDSIKNQRIIPEFVFLQMVSKKFLNYSFLLCNGIIREGLS